MLEIRPNCELCNTDLPPNAPNARICSYECTYCAECVETVLHNVCPTCGGDFQPRPIRPSTAWRPGLGLAHHPASAERRSHPRTPAEFNEHIDRIRGIDPADR
jgi:hypothetical protein